MRRRAPAAVAASVAVSAWFGASTIEAQVLVTDPEPDPDAGVIEASDWDRLGWTAATLDRMLAQSDYSSLLLAAALRKSEGESPQETVAELTAAMSVLPGPYEPNTSDRGSRACRERADATQGVLCSMERLVPVASPRLAREVTDEGARLVASLTSESQRSSADRFASSRGADLSRLDPLQAFAEEAIEGAWQWRTAAAATPGGAADADAMLEGLLGFAPGEGAASLARSPTLARLLSEYPPMSGEAAGLGLAGTDDGYAAFLQGLAGSWGSALRAEIRDEEIGSNLDESMRSSRDSATASEWAAGRAYVYVASRSAGLAGIEAGETQRMLALGTAAVDLRRGVASFPSILAGMGRDLAVSALAGNVLGFASRVTSFFRISSSAPGGSAARDVGVLREGLESLRIEMRAGFEGTNANIDTLFASLDESFGRLQLLVESSNRDSRVALSELHDEILDLGERLDRMDASTRSYLQAGFDRDYSRTLVRCLEHRNRYLPPFDEMEFGVFSDCLSDFRTRAVVDATDALLADRSTLVDDASLVSALASQSPYELAFRLPLLARVARERFDYWGLGDGRRLANLAEWMLAASAYPTLLRDWPVHARAVNENDLEAIRIVGADLRAALVGISVDPTTGERSPLLDRVLTHYRSQLNELIQEADSLARRHRQQVLLQVDPTTQLVRMRDAAGAGPDLAVPAFLASGVPGELRTAALLGIDEMSVVYRMEREDSVSSSGRRRAFLFFGRRHDRLTHSRVSVVLEVRSARLGTVSVHRAVSPFVHVRTEEMNGDYGSVDVRERIEHVPDPVDRFLESSWHGMAADSGRWTRELVGEDHLPVLAASIEDELRRHATSGLDGVFAAICAPDPRASTLSAADARSAERMWNALTGLSAAKLLIEAYLSLAFPGGLVAETPVGAAFSGDAAILDRNDLCDVVKSGESGLRRVWLDVEPGRRLELLRAGVDELLAAQAASGGTLVDDILEQLDVAARVQRLRAHVASVP